MRFKRISLLKFVILLVILLMPVGFSSFVYFNNTSTLKTKNENEYTISVYGIKQSNNITESTPVESNRTIYSEISEDSSLSETTYNPTYEEGEYYGDKIFVESSSSFNSNRLVETIVTIYKQKRIEKINKGKWSLKGYYYTYKSAWYSWSVTITKTRNSPEDSLITSLKVKPNSYIRPFDLNISNYNQYAYYDSESCDTLFDFSKPITGNTKIYIKYYEGNNNGLTEFINSKTSGAYSIYDSGKGGSNGNYDINSDFTYENNGKFDYLNGCVINNGVTINLTYLNNKIYEAPIEGPISSDDATNHRDRNANIALDYYQNNYIGNNNCSLLIRLNADLTIKGTMNIGAKVGGVDSNITFSQIIGSYAQIDLNGHNIIVDGGTLNVYGSIIDRIGTGKIINKNNGTIMGVLVVTDAKGGNQMTYGYGKGQSPFDEYRFAYIEVPIISYYGTTIKGYLKMDLGSLGVSNINANIISKNSGGIFSWGTQLSDTDCLEIIPYINENLFPDDINSQGNNILYTKMYYYRYYFNFKANIILNSQIPFDATIKYSVVKKTVRIDWARIGIPIPTFYDLKIFNNYSLTLKSKLILLPGSSFMTEEQSNVILDPGEEVKYDDVKINVLNYVDVYIKGETKRNCGSIMAYDRSFYYYNIDSLKAYSYGVNASKTYWEYTKPSNHIILGNLTIKDNVDNYKYLLSGPVLFNQNDLNEIQNSKYVKTFDIKGQQVGSWWFNGDHRTYESSVNCISSFNILPLISGKTAYLKDDNLNMIGTFDAESRLFINSNDNKKYFLYTPNDFLIGGSDPKDQNNLTDYTVTPKEVSKIINNQIIKSSDNKYYLNYKGVFVQVLDTINENNSYNEINANIRKFCSNNNSPLYGDSTKYDNVKLKFNLTNELWCFKTFN